MAFWEFIEIIHMKGLTTVNSQYRVVFTILPLSELSLQAKSMGEDVGTVFHLLHENHVL